MDLWFSMCCFVLREWYFVYVNVVGFCKFLRRNVCPPNAHWAMPFEIKKVTDLPTKHAKNRVFGAIRAMFHEIA